MLQLGDDVTLYSVVFVLVLLGTRSPVWTTALTASLYLFVAVFRFPQVPSSRARLVLHPAEGTVGSGNVSVVAHRCGGHDAPENTIVAIREVRGGRERFFVLLHMSSPDSHQQPPSVAVAQGVKGLKTVTKNISLLFHQNIMSL